MALHADYQNLKEQQSYWPAGKRNMCHVSCNVTLSREATIDD